jgi:hypothetical protein
MGYKVSKAKRKTESRKGGKIYANGQIDYNK